MNNKNTKAAKSILNDYSFQKFQMGRCNRRALGVSVILYEDVQRKTNTLELIQKEIYQTGEKAFYIKAEELLQMMTAYLERRFTTEGFHTQFSRYDYLLIDECQIFHSRFATQEEVAELINKLLTNGVSVIIKSSKSLSRIEQLL